MAFFLRLYGIWNAEHSDEYNEVFEALRVCSGHLNLERWAKRFFLYILSIEYILYYLLGKIAGAFASPMDFATKIVRDLSPLMLIGRITSAILGTASVYLVVQLGTMLSSPTGGLLAGLLFSLNSVHIDVSHHARVDATLCFLILLSFFYIARILINSSIRETRDYIFAGLFAGIAFQTKATAIAIVIPFFFAHLWSHDLAKITRNFLDKKFCAYLVFFLIGLFIGNPTVLLAPQKFVKSLINLYNVYIIPINETRSEYIGFVMYLLYFYREIGLPLAILLIYSIFKALTDRKKEYVLLLSFVFPFYAIVGFSRYMIATHYVLPMMAFIYLLCSMRLAALLSSFKKLSSRIILTAWILICLIILTWPGINVYHLELGYSGKSTRMLAKEWIEAHIPFGTRLLMDSGKFINSFAPLIAENRISIQRTLNEKKQALAEGSLIDPTKIVDEAALIYYELLLKTVPNESYDITSTNFGLEVESIDYYILQGYKYLIISGEMKENRSSEFFAQRNPKASAFYRSLDHHPSLKLIKVINPTAKNRGDTFLIYKVDDQFSTVKP